MLTKSEVWRILEIVRKMHNNGTLQHAIDKQAEHVAKEKSE